MAVTISVNVVRKNDEARLLMNCCFYVFFLCVKKSIINTCVEVDLYIIRNITVSNFLCARVCMCVFIVGKISLFFLRCC